MARFETDCLRRKTRAVAVAPNGRRQPRPSFAARRNCILRRFDVELGVRGYPQGVLAELSRLSIGRGKDPAPSPRALDQGEHGVAGDSSHQGKEDWSNPDLYLAPSPSASAVPIR